MKRVWLVWHVDHNAKSDVEEKEKFIGVYSTKKRAQETIDRLRDLPGFRDFPDRWDLSPRDLDDTGWQSGFARMVHGESK